MTAGSQRVTGNGSADERRPTLEQVRSVLERALSLAKGAETRPFEGRPAAELQDSLVPATAAALELALETFSLTVQRYDAEPQGLDGPELTPPPSPETNFYADIDALMQSGGAASQVCDLCLVARIELKGKRERLQALRTTDNCWSIISGCASVRRKVLKSLSAVDAAVAQLEGVKGLCEQLFETELDRSIAVRRSYTAFRRALSGEGTPSLGDVTKAMRRAAVAIAVLVGRDVYEDLRVDDRMQLRELQSRVIEWLSTPSALPRHGLKLWHDLFAFSGMLVVVNNRAELREHDHRLLVAARVELTGADGELPAGASLRSSLKPLLGRDDTLDDFLMQRTQPRLRELRDLVAQLAESLSGGMAPTPSSHSGAEQGTG